MMENVWGIIRQLIAEAGIVNDCDIFLQDFSCQIFFKVGGASRGLRVLGKIWKDIHKIDYQNLEDW